MPSTLVSREVYYTPEQIFALVEDVERYPEFVPYWQAVRVRNRTESGYHTDQVVRLGPMRHTFTTDTMIEAPARITVLSNDPPFKRLSLAWEFHLADDGGCRIDLRVDFEIRSRALQAIGVILSKDSINRMISAFEDRALALYGPPLKQSHG